MEQWNPFAKTLGPSVSFVDVECYFICSNELDNSRRGGLLHWWHATVRSKVISSALVAGRAARRRSSHRSRPIPPRSSCLLGPWTPLVGPQGQH